MPKVLIVDDEPHIRMLIEQTLEELEEEGVEFFSAEDGASGLELALAERPAVLLLDVMMPKMNGFDVCKALKRAHPLDGVTVIMLTAKGQETDRQRGEDAGVDHYLTKPFDPDRLLELVRSELGL